MPNAMYHNICTWINDPVIDWENCPLFQLCHFQKCRVFIISVIKTNDWLRAELMLLFYPGIMCAHICICVLHELNSKQCFPKSEFCQSRVPSDFTLTLYNTLSKTKFVFPVCSLLCTCMPDWGHFVWQRRTLQPTYTKNMYMYSN